ncbi:hypothetical protein GCM10007859_18930 [Brevundimonas denitrificans]|uniref:Outer membrane protein domain-containing protein n=1 Tax=Brevundimonas denitrificans TaxID=1443434 RepID=A0ABQ6BIM1_9CAUL|nr:hypothetical protein [Brevundimonas denitrificans]GLS01875.1 hypothetical protein GCM10007859_18930 [Brevundimonas denitrificans]
MRLIPLVGAALLLSAGSAMAQPSEPGVAVGATAGTSGVGLDVQVKLGPIFTLRGSLDRLTHSADERYDGVDYNADLTFDTVGAFIDMHPMANGLLISGGAYLGDRDIALAATPTGPVEIGGQTYSASQVGTLNGAVKLGDVAPFIGLGWDDTFYRSGRWGFRAVAGVAWSDAPEVALTSTGGSLSNDATFQARLRDESQRITEETEGYGLFPIIQVGLNYKF